MNAHLVGMAVPEIVTEGEVIEISVTGLGDPSGAKLYISSFQDDKLIAVYKFTSHEGKLHATAVLEKAGLYRLELNYGESMTLRQMVMVMPRTILA